MSIEVMTAVWDHSTAYGGDLLIMLSIANYADINGRAYPSIRTLAQRGRMTERNAQYCIQRLEGMGELKVERSAGPHGCHVFHILVGGENIAGVQSFQGCKVFTHQKKKHKHNNELTGRGAKFSGENISGGMKSPDEAGFTRTVSKKEKTNTKTNTLSSESEKTPDSDMSVTDLIESWNDICASEGLPKVTTKGAKNETLLKKIGLRLAENPELEFWGTVLNNCWKSPFLKGEKGGWKVTLGWLVENDRNALKVYEGNYNGQSK